LNSDDSLFNLILFDSHKGLNVKARIEPFSGVMRIWFNDLDDYGSPYQWAAAVRWMDRDSIEVTGVVEDKDNRKLSPTLFKAMIEEAGRFSAKRIGYKRIKQGQETMKWFCVK